MRLALIAAACLAASTGRAEIVVEGSRPYVHLDSRTMSAAPAAQQPRTAGPAEAQKGQPATKKTAVKWPSYPTMSMTGNYWNENGHAPTRRHLADAHGFDYQWLLTQSQKQLNALHADAHDGYVRRSRVVWAAKAKSVRSGHWEQRCGRFGCTWIWVQD